MNTINKLKKLMVPANTTYQGEEQGPAVSDCSCVQEQQQRNYQTITPTESSHLRAVITACPYYYVNGIQTPMPPEITPVQVITVPASQTTRQVINATVAAANLQTTVTGRFIEYFPPPVPPPQQLQPGFVKYNINYGPKYVVPPCVGPRLYRA
jgi:hypothetical protein